MVTDCPYCGTRLGNLKEIMDELAHDFIAGEVEYQTPCCDKRMKATAKAGFYYLDGVDAREDGSVPTATMIGAH